MMVTRQELFENLFYNLCQEDFIQSGNYSSHEETKQEFVKICNKIFQEVHIFDILHEVE